MTRLIHTDRGDHGERVDLVLRRHLHDVPDATRTRVQAWIRGGRVTLNGRIVERVAQRAAPGDAFVVELPAARRRVTAAAEHAPLSVLHEDAGFIVVNKPAGMVVHPTYRHENGTLLNALLWRAREWAAGERPSVVGRLDKLTSGLVVVAKTQRMHAMLQRVFASRAAEKDYLALSHGRVRPARGVIDLRLSRDTRDRRRVVASATTGVAAETEFERVASIARPAMTLLACRLRTGRMHQIRVHLAARGWPIVGDPLYASATDVARSSDSADAAAAAVQLFSRQALHAWRLSFPHPLTGQRVTVRCPLPEDFRQLLTAVRIPEHLWEP